MKKTIEGAIVEGIRKTINRFRERPLNYFTESDIHTSLVNDIKSGNSDLFLYRDPKSNVEISLIHNEYPTNFRYEKSRLLKGYKDIEIGKSQDRKDTLINSKLGDRGHFDLSVISLDFVKKMLANPILVEKDTKYNPVTELTESIKHIINKDIEYTLARCISLQGDIDHDVFYARDLETDLQYAVEVKFIHPFNARNKDMLNEVIKDNTKLNLAKSHTDNFTKTINLIFCSSEEKKRRDGNESVISNVKNYIETGEIIDNGDKYSIPNGVINIFIESYISINTKHTPKPILFYKSNGRSDELAEKLRENLL